jgi:endonuclease/exonuclease/phosphatase (EEP) superfamily protein YafD
MHSFLDLPSAGYDSPVQRIWINFCYSSTPDWTSGVSPRPHILSFQFISTHSIYKLTVITLIAVWAVTLISLFGHHAYLELATHFRLQCVLTSAACLLLLIHFHSWKLLPFAVCCAFLNSLSILPYYSRDFSPVGYSVATNLRLMQINVLGSNEKYATLIGSISAAHPDIVVLQELTDEWWNQVKVLNSEYPYSRAVPRPGGSGMAILSRFPLVAVEELSLDSSTHLALLAKVDVQGTTVSLLSLHPPTPMRADKFLNRNQQFARAASIMKAISGVRILVGDLNTTMWSPYFADLVRESGLRDARKGFGLSPTWPMPLPSFLQIPIDHCLVSDDVVVEGIRTGQRTGSDHRPLVVDLQFKNGNSAAAERR